jgi:hypothetical protein
MMKTTTVLISASLALLSLGACKDKKTTTTTNTVTTTEEAAADQNDKTMMLVIDKTYSPAEASSLKIKSVTVEGDLLSVVVSYSGGCKDHEFRLISNQRYMKSLPPQLNLYLEHNGNGDMCRELIEQTLTFNVAAAQYGGNDSVTLIVNGDRESSVLYTYDRD